MNKQRSDTRETRHRLLTAAAEVFAEKGYWAATHADICEKAKANTAAVNYHFGSKDNLYVESWKFAFEKSILAHPPDGGVSPKAPPMEKLYGRILAFMKRAGDLQACDVDIMQKEMANPTGFLTTAIHRAMEPVEEGFRQVIRELLGNRASEHQVRLCQMSVMTQCFDPMLRSRLSGKALRGPSHRPPFQVEELADHITRFSLWGICGVHESLESKPAKKPWRNEGD
jgi:TetR/AcrR family transcriptional regulator, regulator of cefoperazone and chloramphenicol sensitivity